jgi:hypothetical protein
MSKRFCGLLVGDFGGLELALRTALQEVGFDNMPYLVGYGRLAQILRNDSVDVLFCRMNMRDDATALDMLEHLKVMGVIPPPVILLAANHEEFDRLWRVHHANHGVFAALVEPPWADVSNLRDAVWMAFKGAAIRQEFSASTPTSTAIN